MSVKEKIIEQIRKIYDPELPVNVYDCIEAGLVAMKIDEARLSNKIIDLTDTWKKLQDYKI